MDKEKINSLIKAITFNTSSYQRYSVYITILGVLFIFELWGGGVSRDVGWYLLPVFAFELVVAFISLIINRNK